MADEKPFDVFLSHNSVDKPWVIRLKQALQSRGLKVWLDRDEIRPGDLFVNALEVGLKESKSVALIVSLDSLQSGWVNEEYARALSLAQQKDAPLRLIPVIWRDAELPGFLANRNWVDFRDPSAFEESVSHLVWGITGTKVGGSSATPTKRQAILDRRLAAEMIAALSPPGGSLLVNPQSVRLVLYSLSIFEHLLVENIYGSVLEAIVHKDQGCLRDAILFTSAPLATATAGDFAGAVEDSADAWARNGRFQMLASRYSRSKGSSRGDAREQLGYLQHSLFLAREYDAAIVPHTDRWPLYRWCFEDSIWKAGKESPVRSVIPLPDKPLDAAFSRARAEDVAQLAERLPDSRAPLALVRYGPIPYPFPGSLLSNYQYEDLVAFPEFLFEFCVPALGAAE